MDTQSKSQQPETNPMIAGLSPRGDRRPVSQAVEKFSPATEPDEKTAKVKKQGSISETFKIGNRSATKAFTVRLPLDVHAKLKIAATRASIADDESGLIDMSSMARKFIEDGLNDQAA